MKTQEEILARIEERRPGDMLGFEVSQYIDFLTFENAEKYLIPGTTEEEWLKAQAKEDGTPKTPRDWMIDYMPFAWGKANVERGISAWRSLAHYQAWLWLDGDTELWPTLENYSDYGRPQLKQICDYLKIDYKQYVEF